MNWLIIALVSVICFFGGAVLMMVLSRLLFDTSGEGGLVMAGLGLAGGFTAAVVSLLPSYLLSQKLAKIIEKKWGVKIEKPKKLFWLAVLVPVIVLILAGLVS